MNEMARCDFVLADKRYKMSTTNKAGQGGILYRLLIKCGAENILN